MPSQQAAGGGGGGNADNSLDFLWLVVLIVVGVALVWYFTKDFITTFVYQIRYYEIIGLQFILGIWNRIVAFSHLPLPISATSGLSEWFTLIQTKRAAADFSGIANVSTAVGNYLRYPIAAILVILAVVVYRANLAEKFKRVFNMQRLRVAEQKDWPQITPIYKLDLVKQDINEGPWAMAMPPLNFAKKYNLMKIEKENNKTNISLLNGSAHRVFALQLGANWNGAERLPIYTQALFAICAARANRDRDGSNKLLKQIGASSESGKLDFTGTQELLAKHVNTKLVQRVVSRHAYVLTVMASMLELARTDGVLASAEFLWLKPVDRKLWYMLNSVGRQTAPTEIAGAFAHWLVERKMGGALKVPMVDEAVMALDAALKEIIYEPEEN